MSLTIVHSRAQVGVEAPAVTVETHLASGLPMLTIDVVPALRDAEQPDSTERPILSLLDWPEMSLSLLHGNNQPWIRLQDVPHMLPEGEQPCRMRKATWWKRASRVPPLFS